MARQAGALITALLPRALAGPAGAYDPNVPPTPWSRLSPDEQRILAPVHPDWDHMPGYQQQRLIGSARRYPNMQPIQKERFEARVKDWAAMTPDQRRSARETFQGLRKLPPDKQHELRERWLRERQMGGGSRPPGPPHEQRGR